MVSWFAGVTFRPSQVAATTQGPSDSVLTKTFGRSLPEAIAERIWDTSNGPCTAASLLVFMNNPISLSPLFLSLLLLALP